MVGLVLLLLSFGTTPARAADAVVASVADPSSFDYSADEMSSPDGADFGGVLCGEPTGDGSVSLALSVSTVHIWTEYGLTVMGSVAGCCVVAFVMIIAMMVVAAAAITIQMVERYLDSD